MDSHPLDRPVGSDLSYFVFQRRRREAELIAQGLDSTNQALYPLAGVECREHFLADRQRFAGDSAQPSPLGVALGAVDSE